jgi:hypothetical protein
MYSATEKLWHDLLLEVVQSENKGDFGKEGMHKESDKWKEE